MNCPEAQNQLFELEDPRKGLGVSGELGQHLESCVACRDFSKKLVRLEESVRAMPVPAEADTARARFLNHLQTRTVVVARHRTTAVRPVFWPRVAVAAMLWIAVGLGIWTFTSQSSSDTETVPELVDQLVAWNVDIVQAGTLSDRERVYGERAEDLKRALQQETLPEQDKRLAEALLANGCWLAENDDPVDQADRFTEVADQLLERMDLAVKRNNVTALAQFGEHYTQVAELGINANLDKAEGPASQTPERQRKLERIAQRDAARLQTLESMHKRAPSASRKEIKRAMEASGKQKGKAGRGKKKAPPEREAGVLFRLRNMERYIEGYRIAA